MSNVFFEEQLEQSQIKARIVSKYFCAWANVILGSQKRNPQYTQKMAYIDLFAGPGRYDDQSKSTPLLVLEEILNKPELADRMVTMFNDKDIINIESLKLAINQLDGIERLRYAPQFYNAEVGDQIANLFKSFNIEPTFFFVDPWGYKGLSLNLVSTIIKDWGCDCVFFFNYNRINMGINNEAVKPHMISLFDEDRLNKLQELCKGKTRREREVIIVKALCDALQNNGSKYVLPFRFKNDAGNRTSHHLIFISKNFRGYEIMKDIMFKESSDNIGGVASFEYNPLDMFYKKGSLLDSLSYPIEELQDMLLKRYRGRTIGFEQLFEEHSVGKPYVRKNYKESLINLLKNGRITAINPRTNKPPRKGTFAIEMRITFID